MTGTARYSSINSHLGFESSRRDDLESIGYMLIYFLKGSLPWQGLGGRSLSEKINLISVKKQKITIEELCSGLPDQIAEYLKICRAMKFDETPEYEKLKELFKTNDNEFEWQSK